MQEQQAVVTWAGSATMRGGPDLWMALMCGRKPNPPIPDAQARAAARR